MPLLQALDDVSGQVNLAAALLGRGATAANADALDLLQAEFARLAEQIDARLDVVLALAPTERLRDAAQGFLASGSSPGSAPGSAPGSSGANLFLLRDRELKSVARSMPEAPTAPPR